MSETKFVKTKKERNYTVMDNTFLKDKTLSAGAKGVFAYLLSLPPDWTIYQSELAENFSNGRDSLRSIINELERHGYIVKEKAQGEKGRFAGYNYTIIETPKLDSRDGISAADSPKSENPSLLSTDNNKILNKQNTNIQNLSASGSSDTASSEQTEVSKSNSSSNLSNAEREELQALREFKKQQEAKSSSETKPKKTVKRQRKTKTDEELDYLFSDFSTDDIKLADNCINSFMQKKSDIDPNFKRPTNQLRNWSYELLLFSKTNNRSMAEVARVFSFAINGSWFKYLFAVSNFTKNYEKIIQQCNTSNSSQSYTNRKGDTITHGIDFGNQNYNEIF